MNSMNLKDFNPDNQDMDGDVEITDSIYQQEINSLKIDKLSNRVTIISIIIPCLIGAILIFGYLDMKERVVDVDITKNSQFEKISQQLEEKLNALDVKIAKNSFNLDKKLSELKKKNTALEGQVAKLSALKADDKSVKQHLSKIEKRLKLNAGLDKKNSLAIEKNKIEMDRVAEGIKEDTKLFKKQFDAKLLEFSNFEERTGELKKNISLLNIKYKKIDQEHHSQTSLNKENSEKLNDLQTSIHSIEEKLDKQLQKLNQRLDTNISRLQKNIDLILQTASKPDKPKPQINIDSSGAVDIKEESLTQ